MTDACMFHYGQINLLEYDECILLYTFPVPFVLINSVKYSTVDLMSLLSYKNEIWYAAQNQAYKYALDRFGFTFHENRMGDDLIGFVSFPLIYQLSLHA